MASRYYLKLFHEMLDDWKILSLPDGLKWRFVQCLLVAGELDHNGWLPELRQFAARIRPMTPDALQADLARLAAVELVELKVDADGCERWFIPKFEKRQERSANAKYQSDWRQREKEKKEAKKRKEKNEDKDKDIYVDIDTRNLTSKNNDLTSNLTGKNYKTHTPTYDLHSENKEPTETMAAIAAVVKETLAPGFNEAKFENAAHAIIALDAVDKIPDFTPWWKRNSYYSDNGKPALKTFIDEFQNYLDGVERSAPQKTEIQQSVDRVLEKFNVD